MTKKEYKCRQMIWVRDSEKGVWKKRMFTKMLVDGRAECFVDSPHNPDKELQKTAWKFHTDDISDVR